MPAAVEIAVRGTALVYALVEGASVTVGRVVQCEIHIDDQAVSRRHCTLSCTAATLVVTDLESANGTFVNERPVKSAAARPGDLIRVGSTVLDIVDPDDGAAPRRHGEGRGRGRRAMESVIRKRIEPAEVDWLVLGNIGAARAARSCSARSAISRRCIGSRRCWPAPAICRPWPMPALETILDVTAADRRRSSAAGGHDDRRSRRRCRPTQ